MSFLRVLLLVSVSLALCSCKRWTGVEYSEFVDIPSSGIPQICVYDFSPEFEDSVCREVLPNFLVLSVRYTVNCPSRSIILDIEEMSLTHTIPDSTTVELPLFDEEGKPLGKGNYGIYEVNDTIRKNMKVPEGYTVSVSSPLPPEKTKGIRAVGIILKSDPLLRMP